MKSKISFYNEVINNIKQNIQSNTDISDLLCIIENVFMRAISEYNLNDNKSEHYFSVAKNNVISYCIQLGVVMTIEELNNNNLYNDDKCNLYNNLIEQLQADNLNMMF